MHSALIDLAFADGSGVSKVIERTAGESLGKSELSSGDHGLSLSKGYKFKWARKVTVRKVVAILSVVDDLALKNCSFLGLGHLRAHAA